MTDRTTRYQGAVIRDSRILLVKHTEHESGRSYWNLPGGGMESGESEEECVRRELKEETDLDVKVLSLLLDESAHPDSVYSFWKTYLCEADSGEASVGYEPEADASSWYSITEVKWFDLRDESYWDAELVNDFISYEQLRRLRKKLGYLP